MNRESIVSMLNGIKHLARHASLTGSMKQGTRPMVEIYNKCLESLQAEGVADLGTFFQPLVPEQTSVDEVGTYAALLARYIQPGRAESMEFDDEE